MRQRCRELRDVLEKSPELCTPTDVESYGSWQRLLEVYWPLGAENPWDGLWGWIYCYGQYVAFLRRSETHESRSEADLTLAREAASDALRGSPIYVTLDHRDADGVEQARGVFPKSFHALAHCTQRDLVLAHLGDQMQKLQRINTPAAASALGGALVECAYQQRVLCWIVCHPEPGLPFGDAEFKPDPPEWTGDLSPADIVKILQAHRTVNGARLQLVSYLLSPPDPKTRHRPGSWETLVSTAAKSLGKDARSLARDTTLESLIAQVALAHEAERAA